MLIGILSIGFGGLSLWAATQVAFAIRRVRDWPTVMGRILERGVGESMGQGRVVMPRVRYRYIVGGKEFIHDQVYLIRRTGNLSDAVMRLVKGLPDEIPVHYNPSQPHDAYLLMNPPSTYWTLVVFGCGAMVLGLLRLLVVLLGAPSP